jgi:hypothetical protein
MEFWKGSEVMKPANFKLVIYKECGLYQNNCKTDLNNYKKQSNNSINSKNR